jgi:hypothetical protein
MGLDLHHYFKCPCGAAFGDMTDHPQVEKLCDIHREQGSNYYGGVPEYAKGREYPEGFAAFVQQQQEKGVTMPPEAIKFVEDHPVSSIEPSQQPGIHEAHMLEARLSWEPPPLPSLAQEVEQRIEEGVEDVKAKLEEEPVPSDAQSASTVESEFLPESPRE